MMIALNNQQGLNLSILDAAETWKWLSVQLQVAASSSHASMHLMTVATVDDHGHPDARTVVLRHADPVDRTIRFHSDVRCGKIAAIRRTPQVALHWYLQTLQMQVRIAATATVHHLDATATTAWDASRPMSRACYTPSIAPGDVTSCFPPAPLAPAIDDTTGLAHFAVVVCRFDAFELLALHASGHQRVRVHLDAVPVTWDVLAP